MAWLMAIIMVVTAGAASPAQSLASTAIPASAPTPARAYAWPVSQVRVTRRFDPPPQPWLPGHRGVDLAGYPGEPVSAAAAGRVSFAGTVAGRGVVSVVHPDGVKTTYEPVTPAVARGTAISGGATIGTLQSGHEGCPVDACLHWGAKRGETYIDPLSLLGLGKIRLKPLKPAGREARQPAVARRRRTRRPDRRSVAARPSP
jgi:murein DD-endopeptidase MepM/ murein hydrolase activator NlpD